MARNQIETFMAAIRRLESGSFQGNYGAVGIPTKRLGRARGAYQIMEANWPSWAAAAGIPGANWRSRAAQDRVARYKMSQYYEQYQSWDLVAIAWFAGPGRANQVARSGNIDRLGSVRDGTGTSVPTYVNLIRRYMVDPDNPWRNPETAPPPSGDDDGSFERAEMERFGRIADDAMAAALAEGEDVSGFDGVPMAVPPGQLYTPTADTLQRVAQLGIVGEEAVTADQYRSNLIQSLAAVADVIAGGSRQELADVEKPELLRAGRTDLAGGQVEVGEPLTIVDVQENPPLRPDTRGRG